MRPATIGNSVMPSAYTAWKKPMAVDFCRSGTSAMACAVSEAFPTIMTSGTIMTVAGLLIAYRVSDVYIGHIGLAVGRGALISVILVMTVLPQLIVLMDGLIRKTTFKTRAKTETGGEAS